MFATIISKIQEFILPNICALCRAIIQPSYNLCLLCQQELPWLKNCCPHCGRELFGDIGSNTCGFCLTHTLLYDNSIIVWNYQPPLLRLITQLKFHHQLVYAELLGKLLANHIRNHCAPENFPDCIIPMPLHIKRLRQRGYNQALEIAKPLARELQIPIDVKSCQRIKYTNAQSGLSAQERRRNIKNAFVVDVSLRDKHVAIVEDVITTGSTINELCRTMKKAKVNKISVWCCARTDLRFR